MNGEFSLEGYARILMAFRERGYGAVPYATADPASRHIILRHDVDVTVDAALRVAEVESELQMPAHYFVLLRSDLYNPLAPLAERAIRRIIELGHWIGLHFDPATCVGLDAERVDRLCAAECEVLETWFGVTVDIVSLHRPAPELIGLDRHFGGREHTLQPRYFREMAYCSDSRGDWYHHHPVDLMKTLNGTALQLLTHPVWWDRKGRESAVERLDRLAAARHDTFRCELARNCQPYARVLAERFCAHAVGQDLRAFAPERDAAAPTPEGKEKP